MFARFIGKNGSMGLTKGAIYDIELKTINSFIFVSWKVYEESALFGFLSAHEKTCPYGSFKKFTENWEVVEEEK